MNGAGRVRYPSRIWFRKLTRLAPRKASTSSKNSTTGSGHAAAQAASPSRIRDDTSTSGQGSGGSSSAGSRSPRAASHPLGRGARHPQRHVRPRTRQLLREAAGHPRAACTAVRAHTGPPVWKNRMDQP